ncbi:M23 family metallopeptidase [Plantibacter sp. YIM 135347]|uniref:M23 family metallopeptidase n=1 Tax=Plantibacter sp. YIM 135347 TaxID=3423919 RepID=UPI003D35802B
MALTNYVLNGPSVVILDDNRDPYVSWQNHLARTGRGGVDLVASIGTPVLAPTPGVLQRVPNDGSAGNSSRFHHDQNPGWADVFSHLSGYVGVDGQHFNQGEIIAYTGDSGAPGAPHLHRHLLDPSGTRRNPWDYFGPATPILKEQDLPKIISVPGGTIAFVSETYGRKYTTVSGGEGFSIGSNRAVYGEVTGLTDDQVTTLVNEANARGQRIADLAKA